MLAMATSVLLESLKLLLHIKTATFSISDTSIAQDPNAQHAYMNGYFRLVFHQIHIVFCIKTDDNTFQIQNKLALFFNLN